MYIRRLAASLWTEHLINYTVVFKTCKLIVDTFVETANSWTNPTSLVSGVMFMKAIA